MTIRLLTYLLVAIGLGSCGTSTIFDENKTPIAQVGESVLYYEDIQHILDVKEFSGDSVQLLNNYIEKWSTDQLLYDLACSNVNNSVEIDSRVEEYRKALYIYNYQQQYVEAKLKHPTREQALNYYEANEQYFVQEEKLLRGIFISFSNELSEGNKIRTLLKRYKPKDIETIEKFSFKNAVTYDYFMDNWVEISQIAEKLPLSSDLGEISEKKKFYEYSDSSITYFLYVESVIEEGKVAPFDFAELSAKEMLYNKMKMEFIMNLDDQLFEDALKTQEIVILQQVEDILNKEK